MTKSRQRPHRNPKATFLLALFLLLNALYLMNCGPLDVTKSKLEGKWRGFIDAKDNGRITVDLTVKPSGASGGMECTLHYGNPRTCELVAESTGSKDNLYYFRFKTASGGFCDALYNGEMSLQVNKATLTLRVWHKEKDIDESVELEKQN
jgi:hypothetical protein